MILKLNIITLILCLGFLSKSCVYSLDLSKYRWKNRILILKFDDVNNDICKKQLDELRENEAGLTERKLIIYQLKGEEYKIGLQNDDSWKKIDEKDLKYTEKQGNPHFEAILIGLDGGIKHQQSSVLKVEKLFSIIDIMPMRIREMQNAKMK